MHRATAALLVRPRRGAEEVVCGRRRIDALYRIVGNRVYASTGPPDAGRLGPPAGDHIAAVAATCSDGDLAEHGARCARRRFPACALGPPGPPGTARLVEVADRSPARSAGESPSATGDGRTDGARRRRDGRAAAPPLFAVMFGPDWTAGVSRRRWTTALLGRYYERYADHA